jgi:hypothetical protein
MEMASGERATKKSLSHGTSRAVSLELTPREVESLWVPLKMTPFTSPFQTPKHCLSRKFNEVPASIYVNANLMKRKKVIVTAMKAPKIILCSLGILLFFCFIAHGGEPGSQKENTEKVIAYLIDQVAKSHLTFTRNGTEYSSQEAADHIRNKYEYFKSQIESPEDFIQVCASKSLESGKPYLVSTAQGKVPVEKWLEQILIDHGKKQKLY